ncbi:MAG: M56 family metallopeptidase [Mariniblastus sp.]
MFGSQSSWTFEIAICSSCLIVLAWVFTIAIKRWSAAIRHRVWFLTFCGLLVLPIAILFLPSWSVPLLPAQSESVVDVSVLSGPLESSLRISEFESTKLLETTEFSERKKSRPEEGGRNPLSSSHSLSTDEQSAEIPDGPSDTALGAKKDQRKIEASKIWSLSLPSSSAFLLFGWGVGVLVCLSRLVVSSLRNSQIALSAVEIKNGKWHLLLAEFSDVLSLKRPVRLLESKDAVVPMTWGVTQAVVAVPCGATQWPESRARAVLMHELSHIKRNDVLIQTIAFIVCSFYWFHPLAWFGLRRLKIERELACDDCVIATGQKPTEYAHQLVQIARSYKFPSSSLGVAMASTSKLEYRVTSLLDFARSHVPVSPALSRSLVFGVLIATLSFSVIRIGHRSLSDTGAIASLASALGVAGGENVERPYRVAGIVTTPDGSAKAGASVTLYSRAWVRPPHETVMEAIKTTATKSDGSFEFELTEDEIQVFRSKGFDRKYEDIYSRSSVVIATAPGFGMAWQNCPLQAHDHVCGRDGEEDCIFRKTLELKLAQSTTRIEGRLIDLEGQPIVGAIIRPQSVTASCENIKKWLAEAKDNPATLAGSEMANMMQRMAGKGYGNIPKVVPFPTAGISLRTRDGLLETKTDSQGRFVFKNLGDNRKINFEVGGKGIVTTLFSAVTHDFPSIPSPTTNPHFESQVIFGSRPTVSIQPSRIVRGRITDSGTGKPVVGVPLQMFTLQAFANGTNYCKTDKDGRYEFDGLALKNDKQKPTAFQVKPLPAQPYFSARQIVSKEANSGPIDLDMDLAPCKMIKGRLVNQTTGKPIQGSVMYYPLLTNDNAKRYSKFSTSRISVGFDDAARTDADGIFAVKGVEGKGILAAVADNGKVYKVAVGGAEAGVTLEGGFNDQVAYLFPGAKRFNSIATIDTETQSGPVEIEMVPRLFKTFEVVTNDGVAVVDFNSQGRFPKNRVSGSLGLESKSAPKRLLEVFGLREDVSRELIIWNKSRTHGATVMLTEKTKSPIVLQPVGVVRGKIKDFKSELQAAFVTTQVARGNVRKGWSPIVTQFSEAKTTDGSFELKLLPGSQTKVRIATGPEVKDVSITNLISPGELIDLGLINMKTDDETFDNSSISNINFSVIKSNVDGLIKSSDDTASFSGVVVEALGETPVRSADVAILATKVNLAEGWWEDSEILAFGKTDANGKFEMKLSGATNKSHVNANVVVRKKGASIAFRKINVEKGQADMRFSLVSESIIRGRLLDIEGEPASGVAMKVMGIMTPKTNMRNDGVIFDSDLICNAWFLPIKSDEQGRFEIHGVPAGMGAFLDVAGNDRFAPQNILLNSGESEERGERDATYRPIVKNAKPTAEAVLTLNAAKIFKGVVTFEDSKKPVANTKVSIWASQQEMGSMFSMDGETNEKGEYKLSPQPGIRFGLSAFAPDGSPYLGRVMPPVDWKGGGTEKTLNISLPRGVLVKGVVKNKVTGDPVADAPIQYHPESANNSNVRDDLVTGWQAIQKTDKEGRFAIAVLPGPGRLIVHGGKDSNFILRQFGSRELYDGSVAGRRNYAHAVLKLDPKPGADLIKLDPVELLPGKSVEGSVFDENGDPVDSVYVHSTLRSHPTELIWRAFTNESLGGKFKLNGLDDKTHTIHLLSPKLKLGATAKVKAGETPRVVMRPYGSAKAIFVDQKTLDPVSGFEPGIQMVMVPPVDSEGKEDREFRNLEPNSQYPSNIDRENHPPYRKSNNSGEYVFKSLIPGVKYQIQVYQNGDSKVVKTFIAKASEAIDLGTIRVTKSE